MLLSYERGSQSRPRGHALLYFRGWSDPSAVFATYLIVPPIAVEITKYIPPMFAGQFQGIAGQGISIFPYPPIPEAVDSVATLERLADARDDDLVSGGSVDASSPERLLHAAAEASQQYFRAFKAHLDSLPAEAEQLPVASEHDDVDRLLYGLMSDRERLRELSKLCGQMRYAVSGGDKALQETTLADIKRLGGYLAEKYRVDEIAQAATTPGPTGDKLTELYMERAFKLVDEDYQRVSELEEQIRQVRNPQRD